MVTNQQTPGDPHVNAVEIVHVIGMLISHQVQILAIMNKQTTGNLYNLLRIVSLTIRLSISLWFKHLARAHPAGDRVYACTQKNQ